MNASVYYVAKTGSNSSSGSINQPWLTIQHAADVMIAGDTVFIKSGTYYEKVNPQNSGNMNNYITYQNYPGDEVSINANGNNAAIYIDNASYLHFIGLRLTGVSGGIFSSGGLYALDPSSHIIVDKIISTGNESNGIFFSGLNGIIREIKIKNSEFTDNKLHGIVLHKLVYDVLIDSNYIYNNGWRNNWGHGIKIVDFDNVQGPVGITITNNEISYSRTQGIQTWIAENIIIKNNHFHHNGATGIQIEDYSTNIIIDGNVCEFNALEYGFETGIWVENSDDVIVQNNEIRGNGIGLLLRESNRVITRGNVIYENDGSANSQSNAAGIIIGETTDALIVHNTLHKNGHGSSWRSTFHSEISVSDHVIKNNIFSEAVNNYDFWVDGNPNKIDYNNFYNTNTLDFYWHGNGLTWNNYRIQSAQDSNSHTLNPQFVDANNHDYRLKNNSPNIDTGFYLTTTTSSGNGNVIQVKDVRFFTDGYGIIEGDLIMIGSQNSRKITNVDFNNNTITVDQSISWNTGDSVSYFYSGSAPDIGAYEYGAASPSQPQSLLIENQGL